MLPIVALILSLPIPQAAPVTIEEYLKLERIGTVRATSAGDAVAFTVNRVDLETDEYLSPLYVWNRDEGARPVAPGFADVRTPGWSPDGTWLSFLSAGPSGDAAGGNTYLWVLPQFSDEPIRVGDAAGGVIDYEWAPDGSILALTQSATDEAREFWKIEVPGGELEHIWAGDPGIREMAVSPDGGSIAFSTNGSGSPDDFLNYDLWILEVEPKRARRLTSRAGPEVAPVWSPDGDAIVFRAPQDSRYPQSQRELFIVATANGRLGNLSEAFDRSVIDHRWPRNGDLLFTAAVGTYTHLFAWRSNGAIDHVLGETYTFGAFDAPSSGATIYAVRESATEAQELWRFSGAQSDRLTQLNRGAANWKLGRQSVIQWTAPDGLAVEGLLIYPADYEEGVRYPLLVSPAGGPSRRARNVLAQPDGYQLFAAQGYAVLAPNPRGSSGYGESFGTADRSDLAGGELIDLLAGIDRVVEMGVADPSRLAIYGSGYGGYLTSWAISQTRRFKAAIAVYGGADGERFGESTIRRAGQVSTPLLIVDGTGAAGELIARSQQLYQALSDLGRDVEFAELSSDGDRNGSPHQLIDLFFRQLRWVDRYIKFEGADLFDFFLVSEWMPGPGGWELRVSRATPGVEYTGLSPENGRYLEVTLSFRPSEEAIDRRSVRPIQLDPMSSVALQGPNGTQLQPTGMVTEAFGRETLAVETAGLVTIPVPQSGSPTAFTLRLAFEISDEPAEYRLRVAGFPPVRVWVGRSGT
jgi:dipeptidyl aminopeptidase/acylaminoacyl peptidase